MCSRRQVLAAVIGCVLVSQVASAQVLKFSDPADRFTVEFPRDWNWQIVAGAVEPIVTFIQRGGNAYAIIEHFHMNQPLAPDEITDFFAQVEADVLKENQPRATDVDPKVFMQGTRRIIVLDYRRPGLTGGEAERVRQYSFPVGQDLYRVTCAAVSSQFSKADPLFTALAESFRPAMRMAR
jgi:hypothetical protein